MSFAADVKKRTDWVRGSQRTCESRISSLAKDEWFFRHREPTIYFERPDRKCGNR